MVIVVSAMEDATRAELEQLHSGTEAPALAELALTLARKLDEAKAPTSAAVVARELRAVMGDLRRIAPAQGKGDWLDDLSSKREERRRGA